MRYYVRFLQIRLQLNSTNTLIERHSRAMDAIDVLNVFCRCYTVISVVSSAVLPCKRFVNKRHYSYTTPHLNR